MEICHTIPLRNLITVQRGIDNPPIVDTHLWKTSEATSLDVVEMSASLVRAKIRFSRLLGFAYWEASNVNVCVNKSRRGSWFVDSHSCVCGVDVDSQYCLWFECRLSSLFAV